MKNYLPINWTDGVKLTKDHFVNSYFNNIATINQYSNIRLNKYNYGITDANGFDIEAKVEGGKHLVARLRKCNIIANNGHIIVFDTAVYGDELPMVSKELDPKSSEAYYVIVSVNPYSLIPVGVPDPEIVPLHHPNAAPEIKLHILKSSEINESFLEGYFLIVSKCALSGSTFDVDSNYIPPVVFAKNDKRLVEFNSTLIQNLNNIYDNAIRVHKKNISNSANNRLILNTFALSDKIIDFYTTNIFYLKNISLEESPIFMFDRLFALSNSLLAALTIMD